MADLHDAPSDGERNDVEGRVRAAADAGRISAADRDIRLGNVRSAQSRADLDLMRRDLDQLDASAATSVTTRSPPTPTLTGSAPAYSTFNPGDDGEGPTGGGTSRARVFLGVAVVAVVIVLGLVVGLVLFSHRDTSPATTLPPAQSPSAGAGTASPSSTSSAKSHPAGDYSLSAAGIRGFLATYATKFHTTRVVDLVMYPTYVVVDVPVAGGRGRQQGWLYRQGSGWTGFGGVRAVFPGSSTVDTRQLDVDALVRNIRRARATLKVEAPSQTYVIVRFIPQVDAVPSVDIHVANGFQESGYLATALNGRVERAYPFGG